MKTTKLGLLILAATILSSCSITVPVRGQSPTSDEVFTGTATGRMDGAGEMQVVSNKGAVCTGNFVYVTRREGEGIFVCEDGRTGPFKFVSTGSKGVGTGQIGKETFTFTFGN